MVNAWEFLKSSRLRRILWAAIWSMPLAMAVGFSLRRLNFGLDEKIENIDF